VLVAISGTRRATALAGATLLLLAGPEVVPARDRSPTEVLNAPGRFDGQAFVLAGTVSNVRERVSRHGLRYYLFDLDDGIRAINVLKTGTLACPAGAFAVVEGSFLRTRRFDGETFPNQIRASRVVCR
jgi:hypothetical protein